MTLTLTPAERRNSRLIALLLAAACALSSYAVPTTGGREDTGLRLTDSSSGRTLISPNGATIVSDTTARTDVTITPAEGGMDISVTYTNPGATPLSLGAINIGGIRLGNTITQKEFHFDVHDRVINSGGQQGTYGSPSYPDGAYSPVVVFSDDNYTFGASLCYPLEDYDHSVDMFLQSKPATSWGGGPNWQVSFRIWGQLPAGASRTYKATIRFADKNTHWLETLKPYRDYFHALYGDVRYQRDPRPVRTFAIAYSEYITAGNPRGFYNPNLDPSHNGYGPWANYIRTRCQSLGFERTMIWAPTGLYYNRRDDNFPCLFMTGADSIPIMGSTISSFSSVSAAGIDLGFWFGYSSSVAPGGWDTGHVRIDPDNPAHLALAWREMDRAAALGAKCIGLDAFGWEVSPGKSLRYLKLLTQRYPQIRFVTEVSLSDVYHVYAPTFQFGNQVSGPNTIADFLLPGNETWALTGYVTGSDQAMLDEMRRFAAMGYVPLSSGMISPTPDILAAETWNELPNSVRLNHTPARAQSGNGTMAAGLGDFLTRNRTVGSGSGNNSQNTLVGGDNGTLGSSQSTPPGGALITPPQASSTPQRQRVRFAPSGINGDATPVATPDLVQMPPTGTADALARTKPNAETPTLSSLAGTAGASAQSGVGSFSGARNSTSMLRSGAAAFTPPDPKAPKKSLPFVQFGSKPTINNSAAKSALASVLPNAKAAAAAANRARQLDKDDRANANANSQER